MRKINKYLSLGLLSVIALSSCKKEQDLPVHQTGETIIYSATSQVADFKTSGLRATTTDEARATLVSTGFHLPTLKLQKNEISASYSANWAVLGKGGPVVKGSATSALSAKPTTNQTESKIFIEEGTKTLINMYCPISNTFDVKDKFAFMALGGRWVTTATENYLEYKGNTSPNQKIEGIKKGERLAKRHLPIMTDVMPFKKLLAPTGSEAKERVHFKPRGVLVGFCFVNKFNKDIKIKNLVLEADNALYFEGKFNVHQGKTTNFFNSSSAGKGDEKAKFEGVSTELKVPVYKGNTQGYALSRVMGAVNKDNLPQFFVWGYPNSNENRIKLKVEFVKNSQTLTTKTIKIKLPSLGFKEGSAYRLDVKLDNSLLNNVVEYPNPLDYVGKFAVNKNGTAFVNHHNLPPTTELSGHAPTDVGYFKFNEAPALFTKSFLSDYMLPTQEHWQSIIPYHHSGNASMQYVQFEGEKAQHDVTENTKVGSESINCSSQFMTKEENGEFVTYAKRFIGSSKWVSAWRYSTRGSVAGKDIEMVIECTSLKGKTDNLSDITSASYFNSASKRVTKRTLPAYGYAANSSSSLNTRLGTYGFYLSSTEGSGKCDILHFRTSAYMFRGNSYQHKGTVLPFYKVLSTDLTELAKSE